MKGQVDQVKGVNRGVSSINVAIALNASGNQETVRDFK
jgi:hypothetical protein